MMTCLCSSVHHRLHSPFVATSNHDCPHRFEIYRVKSHHRNKILDNNRRNSIHGNKNIKETEPLWGLHGRFRRRTSTKKETNQTSSLLEILTESTRPRETRRWDTDEIEHDKVRIDDEKTDRISSSFGDFDRIERGASVKSKRRKTNRARERERLNFFPFRLK